MADQPRILLNTGASMPQLGFGVFQVTPDEVEKAVATALETGYRSIDTAAMYQNEEGVGRAIVSSGIPRKDIFLTTKLDNAAHKAGDVEKAFDASLTKLGVSYLDLYLIHWPLPKTDRYVEVWREMEKLHSDGRTRAIGVSNFQTSHLRRLLDAATVAPAVNQIELHPYLTQEPLRTFHRRHHIATEAWSPIGRGGELLRDPIITAIAEKYAVTPAQIVIRWHLQLDNIVIPRSVTPERIRENFDVFGFELDPDDIDAISALNRNQRIGPDPDDFEG
ncbi:MAG: 2,5-diketo-D-gluconate reductase [Pseudonocardiales bacterium]|nr:2,5-diketo-D-gluconate reductase [Pseudonocardiales bacterium]